MNADSPIVPFGQEWRDHLLRMHKSKIVDITQQIAQSGLAQREQLKQENAILREALAVYANRDNWTHGTVFHSLAPGYQRAEAALSSINNEPRKRAKHP